MPEQTPSIGRIVIYHSSLDDRDYPAIITEVLGDLDRIPGAIAQGGDRVHLHCFIPPTGRADHISPEWGVPYAAEPTAGCWRWPERV